MRMQWIALSALHDDVWNKKKMCNLCVEYPAACTALTPTENESICCSRYRRTHTHTLESDRIYSTHLPHSYCEFLLSVCFLFEFPCRCRLIILFNLKYKYYSCDANDNIVGCCAICFVSCSGHSTQHDCIALLAIFIRQIISCRRRWFRSALHSNFLPLTIWRKGKLAPTFSIPFVVWVDENEHSPPAN